MIQRMDQIQARKSGPFHRQLVWATILLSLLLPFFTLTGNEEIEPESNAKTILVTEVEGPISPATSEHLLRSIRNAEESQAIALLVQLDTPGGLMTSMDDMIRAILGSRVPVILYVGPAGATCGSAGVYLMYASHLAVMAPATNLGSATPITMGSGSPAPGESDEIPEEAGTNDQVNLKRKVLHHSLAQIKSLAEYRNRNQEFARQAILEAKNITSTEALKLKVIDFMAESPEEVVARANGRSVRMLTENITLDTQGVKLVYQHPDNRFRILAFLSDPGIATTFMMIGILGILAEIQYPGTIFPGIVGSISLLLGLYAMQTLSVNYAGMGLVLLGVLFFVLEIFTISFGFFTTAGVISLVLGAIMLFPGDGALLSTTGALAAGMALATGAILAGIIWKASSTLRKPGRSTDGFVKDETGISRSTVTPEGGSIFIAGEIWHARSVGPIIPAGTGVRIRGRSGMTLFVEPGENDPET